MEYRTDPLCGQANLSPNDVFAELKFTETSLDKTKDGLYVAVVLKPNVNWVKIGQLEKGVQ